MKKLVYEEPSVAFCKLLAHLVMSQDSEMHLLPPASLG
jgi:hypothetical protein